MFQLSLLCFSLFPWFFIDWLNYTSVACFFKEGSPVPALPSPSAVFTTSHQPFVSSGSSSPAQPWSVGPIAPARPFKPVTPLQPVDQSAPHGTVITPAPPWSVVTLPSAWTYRPSPATRPSTPLAPSASTFLPTPPQSSGTLVLPCPCGSTLASRTFCVAWSHQIFSLHRHGYSLLRVSVGLFVFLMFVINKAQGCSFLKGRIQYVMGNSVFILFWVGLTRFSSVSCVSVCFYDFYLWLVLLIG